MTIRTKIANSIQQLSDESIEKELQGIFWYLNGGVEGHSVLAEIGPVQGGALQLARKEISSIETNCSHVKTINESVVGRRNSS